MLVDFRMLLLLFGLASVTGDSSWSRAVRPVWRQPTVAIPAVRATSAFLRARHTVRLRGKPFGLGRQGVQGLVDQCNALRDLYYQLGPVSPDAAALADLDVSIHEKYIAGEKALTRITSHGMVLTDMRRWLTDARALAATGAHPPVPMNCAEFRTIETKTATLWRDSLKYEIRYANMTAIGHRSVPVRLPSSADSAYRAAPISIILGQTCHNMSMLIGAPPPFSTCIWDLLPYAPYLNWPFALSGSAPFGPGAELVETIEALDIESGPVLSDELFRVPEGFRVTVLK